MRLTTVSVAPAIIPGSPSGINTLYMISNGVAPIDCAASMMPRSTSRSDDSTTRPTNGIAATESGTIAAFLPIDVPTIARVKGIRTIISITNGADLPMFTTRESEL
jgi:hypothetical protein